ncbi:STAS domain-containing protein [Streptomyces sp. Tu 2975]|uniref:STAS domain-containing protein n=1 Tax=Streptomyces sp. Tu 2975 TaxID=2676871 RepID=UPI001FC9F872|nr:STAS domain-containing protein [Streptomyces sp. Tu 2975]
MQPIVMHIAGRVAPGDAARLCEELTALLRDAGPTASPGTARDGDPAPGDSGAAADTAPDPATAAGDGGARCCRAEVVCDVGGLARTSLAVVEVLARLQLTARRHGTRIRLRNAPPDLVALLGLVGLSGPAGLGESTVRAGP